MQTVEDNPEPVQKPVRPSSLLLKVAYAERKGLRGWSLCCDVAADAQSDSDILVSHALG